MAKARKARAKVIKKPVYDASLPTFRNKEIPMKGYRLVASTSYFSDNIEVFCTKAAEKFDKSMVWDIIRSVNKKCAYAIAVDLWKMKMPMGLGILYAAQSTRPIHSDTLATRLLNLGRYRADYAIGKGGVRCFARWTKEGAKFKHRSIYRMKTNAALVGRLIRDEQKRRAEDRVLPPYSPPYVN